jgi:2-polyprenyl-6-methoxyphenol hydroxylase-like FAD-dependent oxidoreductase
MEHPHATRYAVLMAEGQVLVVGAGPTGLALALWLTRLGVGVRIIDKAAEPGTTSRALAVQARTLEFYRQVGLADTLVDGGRRLEAVNFWVAGRRVARAVFGAMGAGLSPFPYALIFPQDEHERVLIDRLAEAGVKVEHGVELLAFEDTGSRVVARLRRSDGTEETCDTAYLAGCDGAHSTVRETLGIGFPGGTYEHLFYVADVDAHGPAMNGELHASLDEAEFVVIFPLKGDRRARFVGVVREEAETKEEGLTWDDVSKELLGRMRVEVERVNWFSTYRVHHRVADRFQKGRAFLLGDAAHIHSPVGGQGMNTGIGDAMNLAWKLAAVLRGGASGALVDTYEAERIAFARRLVATTDRAFTVITSRGRRARWVRLRVAPRVIPVLASLKAVRRLMFRTISQTAIHYRGSLLSVGAAGRVRSGDRLPWVELDGADDNFTPLASLGWQMHVYGDATPELVEVCRQQRLALHVFPWRGAMRRVGLRQHAGYLIRPDGHVGLADPHARAATLQAYLDDRGLRLGGDDTG